mmetsp:Transcript_15802/g.37668  ORF Transcript_15802/g.37668 Transcript_15802/m.37668 type:complete len:250 (+) Transcript_15802:52-801(+)
MWRKLRSGDSLCDPQNRRLMSMCSWALGARCLCLCVEAWWVSEQHSTPKIYFFTGTWRFLFPSVKSFLVDLFSTWSNLHESTQNSCLAVAVTLVIGSLSGPQSGFIRAIGRLFASCLLSYCLFLPLHSLVNTVITLVCIVEVFRFLGKAETSLDPVELKRNAEAGNHQNITKFLETHRASTQIKQRLRWPTRFVWLDCVAYNIVDLWRGFSLTNRPFDNTVFILRHAPTLVLVITLSFVTNKVNNLFRV